MQIVSSSVRVLRYLAQALVSLRHTNGTAVCELYGAHAAAIDSRGPGAGKQQGKGVCLPGALGQGPVVAFNLLRSCGSYVGYRWGACFPTCDSTDPESRLGLSRILLPGGCSACRHSCKLSMRSGRWKRWQHLRGSCSARAASATLAPAQRTWGSHLRT